MHSPRSAAAQASALQGDALHAFLEQAHELLHDESSTTIAHADRIAAVVELMAQQSFAPTTVTELERVHDFWLMLEQPATANAFLQTHRQAAWQGDERHPADAQARIALSDIQSRLDFDRDSAVTLLLPTAQALAALPDSVDASGYWQGWHWMAHKAQAWEIAAQGVDLERAQERADPDNEDRAAYLDAMALVRKAELDQRRGDGSHATRHVQAAIDRLRDAGPEQGVDFEQWMELADRVLPIVASSLPALLMACEKQLARDEQPAPSQAVRAHRKVRIARLQAQACAQAGQLDAAVQLSPQGHFGLTDDHGDAFGALRLDWLVQAGHMDQAAALALESVLHARPGSAQRGCQLAQERFAPDSAHATTWAVILACAREDEDMRQMLAQEPGAMPLESADFYLDFVRSREPDSDLLALMLGLRHAAKRQMQQALPLLEQSVGRHPEWADSDKLPKLWAARFAALPLEEALARPFPNALGGHWCYGTGVTLDDADDLAPLMGGKKKVPADEVLLPLVIRYYEQGLERFEQFWATGQGRFKDADLHVYSMLCNNLAIKYRFADRYDEAAALHHKGLASSPFAEHQDGLLWCAIGKDDDTAIVAEAERLWHFVQRHGYGRHDPANYFSTIAMSLYKLDRGDEISIWLERLDQWFEELDEEDQRDQRRRYLAALMSMLDFFSVFRPEQVLPRLRAYQQEVRALKESYALRRLGCALEAYPELLEECVAMHQEAVGNLGKNDNEAEHRMAHEGLERAQRLLAERDQPAASSKPWWKFW
ncbi:MAG: hypothetical protein LBE51_07620 [Acidovorax sp.]|jgi:tetratricopeptide (TPR) repeat protein|nr:hypothetical protein [Acidovorax sp.]